MPINTRVQEFDTSQIRLKKTRDGYDIMLGREDVGAIDFVVDERITKADLVENQFEGNRFLREMFESVPDNYKFNYYYIDEIILWSSYRGTGIGAIALQQFFGLLKDPACVGLTPARIGNVPKAALLRFYQRNGFKVFKHQGDWAAITFIKTKKRPVG